MLSVLALQLSVTELAEVDALRLVGAPGGAVSTVQLAVAGEGSFCPFAVAYTVKVWGPSERPL